MADTFILQSFALNLTKGRELMSHMIINTCISRQTPGEQHLIDTHVKKNDTESRTSAHLQYALLELAELKRALSASQQQLNVSQQQINTLSESNSCLRQKLIRITKKCAQACHSAYHDELTGLPNRSLLLSRLKQAMAQSNRQNKQVALLFIDLDKFKNINDRLGHALGDKLLPQVAKRLSVCIRYADTACRYGGDEFVIMLPEIDGQEKIATVAEKIRTELAAPYMLDSNVVTVTASIGAAVYRAGGQSCNDLIKQADISMYHDKTHCNQGNRIKNYV